MSNVLQLRRMTIAVALGSVALGAAGQDMTTLEKMVISAAGFEQKITDAPASISVVEREELEKRPYMTLIDAVRDLEGVDVGETSDKTGQRTISLRGMGPEYTLILIDGKRQNNHGDIYPNNFGGNQFNHIPPLDAIERIEVIRGPASTLYGADALGGVINIITKKVGDSWHGSTTMSRNFQEDDAFGTDSTVDFYVSGPLIADTLGVALRASWYERDASTPEYEIVYDPAGNEHERSLGFGSGGKTVDNTNKTLGGTLNWKISDRQDLSFDYDISRQEYDNNPFINNLGSEAYPLGTVDGVNSSSLWRSGPRVGYVEEQEFSRDQWSLTHNGTWDWGNSFVSLAYIETDNNGRTLPFTVQERVLHEEIFRGRGDYAGMSVAERQALVEELFLPRPKRTLESSQYTLDVKLDIPVEQLFGDHLLVVGGQVIDGELDDGVFGMEGGSTGEGVVQEHKMYSLFVEDNWTPVDPLTVTAGIRYDEHDLFGSHVSPRLYGVYTLTPAWTIKGGVSTGYKTPKTTDLFDGITGFGGQGTSPWTGNPDLEPETSVNTEVALYWKHPIKNHNFNITYFHNDFEDKIASTTVAMTCEQSGGVRPCANLGDFSTVLGIGSLNQPINIDEAKVQGVEMAGRYQIFDALSLRANYTWTDSEQKSGAQAGRPLTNTAEHMANATLDWQATDKFSVQLMLEARSDRYRGVNAEGDHLHYKDYEVFHLGATYRLTEHVTVNGRINNLLDQDFTSFQTSFVENADGTYSLSYTDDYNNKDKARNFWLSVNVAF
ncbi:MAG: TonB-dependent receptor [Porticoccaceae bacterium]